jgi:WD40 repeat protein
VIADPRGDALRRLRHGSVVSTVAFSCGEGIASASEDGTAVLWDAATGREIRRLDGFGLAVLSLAFSPDSRLLATGGHDGTILVWDVGR